MDCDKDKEGCWAQLEWFCEHAGIARVFYDGQEYGDPYCYALPFVVRERFKEPDELGRIGMIEYIGMSHPVTRCQYRAGIEAMHNAGWGILITRVKNGHSRTIEICRGKRSDRTTD